MKKMGFIATILALSTITIGALPATLQAQKVKFTFTNISVPNAVETDAYAIDNKNLIVGDYINAAGQQVGMSLKGSKVTSVSCPGGGATILTGINAGGSAAAEADDDGGDGYCGNGATIYLLLHHLWSFAPQSWGAQLVETVGVNDLNQAVGVWEDANDMTHGFLFDFTTGGFTSLDVPGASSTIAWGINNAGTITLQATDAAGNTHAYLYNGDSYRLIDVPNAVQSFVHGINNNGDIVYTVEDANGFNWGVYFRATQQEIYWFNQPDGRDNTRAYGINDEVVAKNGTVKLKIVGEYTPPGTTENLAYEGTITIKP
jgi:hypothetical protein